VANREISHAYYEDEEGDQVAGKSMHLNRFRAAGAPRNQELKLPNLLDPAVRKQLLQPQWVPFGKHGAQHTYRSYVGQKTWQAMRDALEAGDDSKELKVTLLFGAGSEGGSDMDVAGLRYFLEQVDDRMLINVPGEERPRFDVGISGLVDVDRGIPENQVERFIDLSQLKGIPYKITTLAAYSTGYGCLNQCVNEKLLPLDDIETIVYYDCLYRADRPRLPPGEDPPTLAAGEDNPGPDEIDASHPGSAYNTRRAIDAVLAANPATAIVAYAATLGGSPRYKHGAPSYMVDVPTLIDLRTPPTDGDVSYAEALYALVLTRCLDYAETEGLISSSDVPEAFGDLSWHLPKRGTVASSQEMLKAKGAFAPTTTLIDWGRQYRDLVKAAQKQIDAAIGIIADRELMYPGGYPWRGNPSGALHHAMLPEFGWEYLV
jgi:hypothetical protein